MRSPLAAARTLVLCLLATCGVLSFAAPAAAHGQLASSTPTAGSTVEQPLQELRLYFTERPASTAFFSLTTPSGKRIDAGWSYGEPRRLDKPVQEYLLVDGTWEPRVYNTGFPAVVKIAHWPETGGYTATYMSVASDGEPVRGTVAFTYSGRKTPAPAGWTPPADTPSPQLLAQLDPQASAAVQPTTTPAGIDDADNTPQAQAEPGTSVWSWMLPAVLVAAVAVVVLGAARRRPPPAAAGKAPARTSTERRTRPGGGTRPHRRKRS